MGSYTFKWELPAEEVFVTGTFDNWTKSEKLDKVGDVFTKTVSFQDASKKIYYKFVVDHAWIISETSSKEADHEGNVNNVLTPEDMASEEPVAQAIASETTESTESTTAQPASEQPVDKVEEPKVEAEQAIEQVDQPAENVEQSIEKEQGDEKPETVENAEKEEAANDQAEENDIVKRTENVATPSDVPGGFPASPPVDEDKIFSISPLPAAVGAVNPIKLAPGEPVPNVFVEGINTHVKLDEASYERSDALPGVDLSELQPPSVSADVIPESGLSVADAFAAQINTIGPTTLGLAAEVPLEAKVPDIVHESQTEAGLLNKIPEAPATSVSAPAEVLEDGAGIIAGEAAIPPAEIVSAEQAAAVAQETEVQQEDKPAEAVAEVTSEVKDQPTETNEEPEAAASTTAAVEEKKAEEEVATEPVEEKRDEVKAEEAAPETKEETAQVETKAETTEPAEPTKSEVPVVEEPNTSAAVAAEPVTVETTAAPAEPESAGPTQVEDSAEAAPVTEETAPVAEAPDADATPQTPRSEGTEVSPNAEANGSDEKSGSPPSDKKRKSRLSSFFSRILFRAKPSDK